MNRIMMFAAMAALVATAPACDKKDGGDKAAADKKAVAPAAAPAAGGDKAAAGDKAAPAADKAAPTADKADPAAKAAPAGTDKPAVAPPAPGGEVKFASDAELETVITGFEGIVKGMCECKDETCVKTQQGAMMAFMQKTQSLGRPDPKAPGTAKFMERMGTASKSMQACIKKVMPNGLTPPAGAGQPNPADAGKTPPTGAQLKTAMTEFEAIVDDICKCTDAECTKSKRAGLTAFMMKTRAWGRPDMNDPATKDFMGKMQAAGKKMADCMAKTAPKPDAAAPAPGAAPKKTEAPAPAGK